MEKKSLDCIKCGGPLSNMGGENKYICDYCKTPYLVEEEDDKYVLSIIDSRLSSLEDKIKGIAKSPEGDFFKIMSIGDVIEGRVIKVGRRAAVIDVHPIVEGHIYAHHCSDKWLEDVNDVLSVGDVLDFMIIGFERDPNMVWLSRRTILQNTPKGFVKIRYKKEDKR